MVSNISEVALQTVRVPTREEILDLQDSMLQHQTQMPEAIHRFAPGMYMREFNMPAGMLVVGKTHKHAHFMMIMHGKAHIVSEFGNEVLEAGHISVSQPGVKRVVLALEDTRFITLHVNEDDTHDLGLIEARHIEAEPLFALQKQEMEKLL